MAVLAVAALLQAGAAPPDAQTEFKVICHPGVKGAKVSREVLADIFLKRILRWGDGVPIDPVEHSLTSPIRAGFSRKILGRSPTEVQIYWSKALRDGVRPPVVKGNDDEVIAYVSSSTGAIGYITSSHELPGTVKAVEIQ